MTASYWLGDDRTQYMKGQFGFLVRLHNKRRNFNRMELRQHPAREAGTLIPVLEGVVNGGETDVYAMGIGEVVEALSNGRGHIQKVDNPVDVSKFLDKLGYTELDPHKP